VPSQCTKPYEQPASWDTKRVVSPIPEIADYIEPINVVISGCSTVSLSDIQAALGNWDTVSDMTPIVFDTFRINCVSPEKADVAGRGYVTQDVAWRLDGCLRGNALSVIGLENHVRIWNQAVPGSRYGAWFITASYETACVSKGPDLFTFESQEKHPAKAMKFWHCVDGGPGSFFSNGYNRGAADFADDVVAAAQHKGWKVTEEMITRPITEGNIGEDGVPFDDIVYVLTVTE
jgi:hypothetical protein